MQNTLLVIIGPTGVGKTGLSAEIASQTGSEVISCDSRQFYREMITGTSVPPAEILEKIPHHFIRFISVRDYYSASLFERDVMRLLPALFQRCKTAVMTGGSGMYIDAVCEGIDDIPDTDPAVREKYNSKYREEGIGSLRLELKLRDPVHYASVDLKNPKRIIRALEICESTGRPYSSFLKSQKPERDFRIIKLGLTRPREELYEKINIRVDEMIRSGLEEEARSLFKYRHLNALNAVGYREFFDYFDGNMTLGRTIELIKRNTRRYAKRQISWFARDKSVAWFHPDDRSKIAEFLEVNGITGR